MASPNPKKNLADLIRDLELSIGINPQERHDEVAPLIREFREKAEKIVAGDVQMQLDLGLAFLEMGLYVEAAEHLGQIEIQDSQYLFARSLLAQVLRAQGNDIASLEILKSILRDDRSKGEVSHDARYELIQLYLKLDDKKKAMEHARLLEKEAPGYRDIHGLMRNLGT